MNSVFNLRPTLAPIVDADTQPALTRMLAVAQVKFGWVEDLPFFLWQVNSPQSARTFLDKFDNQQSQHHRVTLRFGTGDLRSDTEAWAADHCLSDALRVELLSYQWCKLDNTLAESSHRDVSREASRCTNASQAWISATLRMHQNLDMWETLDFSSRRRF